MFEEMSFSESRKGKRQSQESPKSLGSLCSVSGKREKGGRELDRQEVFRVKTKPGRVLRIGLQRWNGAASHELRGRVTNMDVEVLQRDGRG